MLQFPHPYILVLIPIIFLLWIVFFCEKIWYIAPNPLIKSHSRYTVWYIILWILRFFIVWFFILLISWAYIEREESVSIQEEHKILIVLDISRSMLAEDISPSRIIQARKTLLEFVWENTTSSIGLIVFAGKPFLMIPFTKDREWITSIIRWVSPESILQSRPWLSGTAIGDAILLATDTLSWSTTDDAIIVVTDGRSNIGLNPYKLLWTDQVKKFPIYSIGIWSLSGGELFYHNSQWKKEYLYDESGSILRSGFDETLLQWLSTESRWRYYTIENASSLSDAFSDVTRALHPETILEKRIIKKTFILEICLILSIVLFSERWMLQRMRKLYL